VGRFNESYVSVIDPYIHMYLSVDCDMSHVTTLSQKTCMGKTKKTSFLSVGRLSQRDSVARRDVHLIQETKRPPSWCVERKNELVTTFGHRLPGSEEGKMPSSVKKKPPQKKGLLVMTLPFVPFLVGMYSC